MITVIPGRANRTRVNPSSVGASTMCTCTSGNDDGNKNAPVSRGVSYSELVQYLARNQPALRGGFLGRVVGDLRSDGARGRDRNAAGFLGFGNLANEIDVKQAILKRGVFHLHEIGKLERPLEGARRDAAIQHLGFVLAVFIGGFVALDRQRIFLGDDGELALRKAGDRDADAIGVLAGSLDIVGRIAGAAVRGSLVEQRKPPVEADGGTIKWGETRGTHRVVLH